MNFRTLGRTGFEISEIGLGTWQVGGRWGTSFDNNNADLILNTAVDNGINFIDTADVYSAGLSEEAVGRLLKSRSERIYVATKCGRQINPHVNEGYTTDALRGYVEDSLRRLGVERIDLIQLHCPPTEVYYRPEIFGLFERLHEEGKIDKLGISVEKVEEALKGIEYSNVDTVQIIFNIFRQRPTKLFFEQANKRNIGIIVRVPLASGLLTGKFSESTTFGVEDHRHFNRDGAGFDKGETFSGVPYELGLKTVRVLEEHFPEYPITHLALKYILMFNAVSCVIPGASKPEQILANLNNENYPDLDLMQMGTLKKIYDELIREKVHHLW
jgi:aryl-alcohol dehydrogenase-like predicted oxidoreductase